ncbi:MAG: MATE family efflux transporter [Parvularculaceae bacterium]
MRKRQNEIAPPEPGYRRETGWMREVAALVALGAPMGLTQLIQFSVNTIDVLMIGRIGAEALAASSLGLVVFYATFLVGFGPAMAISPMVAQALGADRDNFDDVRRSVRMGLWATALAFPAIVVFYLFARDIALALGQPDVLADLAAPYILALAPGWPFMIGVLILRNFLAAIDRTRAPLVIIVVTTILNALMNYTLIYGNWGFPRLELVGAGLASSAAHFIGFAMLVVYIGWDGAARQFDLFRNMLTPCWARLREIVRLGWPIGVSFAFEMLLFNAAVLLMGRIGVDEVAAYQVALNVAAIAFMMPLGFSMAGCVRVGLAQGAGDADGVRRAALLTIVVSVATIMIFAVMIVIAPHWVAGLYLDAGDPANANVLGLVASFLPIAAAFMLFDGAQVAASQVLRGLKDVRIPMILTGVSYWLIGFPVAFGFGLYSPLGATGVWWGLLAGLAAASILLGARVLLLVRKPTSS